MTLSSNPKRPLTNQRHVTYKKREVEKFYKMEETLMDEFCITYSDLVKKAVSKLYEEYKISKIGNVL